MLAIESTPKTTLETSGKDVKLHSNEWKRCETTLETSGKDVKLHSKRVEKMKKITLETSEE